MSSSEMNKKNTEFESKYRTEADQLFKFKFLVTSGLAVKSMTYVEGTDRYYVKPGTDDLWRYRTQLYGSSNQSSFQQLTKKVKPKKAKNNIKRKEWNIQVVDTEKHTVQEALEADGYEFNFEIWKSSHIYDLGECILVLYTVIDITDNKPSGEEHFIEIEVNESTIHTLTEEQAWGVIKRYEEFLAPIGISAQKRLKKSLFEMYRR